MPELPDLLYLQSRLRRSVCQRRIETVEIKQPVVLRSAAPFGESIIGRTIDDCKLHGPFIRLELSGSMDLVINLMLSGRLHHEPAGARPEGHRCFSLHLHDGFRLTLADENKMAKAYLVTRGEYRTIPKYPDQGIDVMSPRFTLDAFRMLASTSGRKQVRVFINDHTSLSVIGNAYADEILFEAKIHPKTFVAKLSPTQIEHLYASILAVMQAGIRHVEEAGQPIHVKVRDHMKVRNRKDEPCPRCGTKIRREGVRGFDVYFCPACQPASRKVFIDWKKT